jgi:hypothetical protein
MAAIRSAMPPFQYAPRRSEGGQHGIAATHLAIGPIAGNVIGGGEARTGFGIVQRALRRCSKRRAITPQGSTCRSPICATRYPGSRRS